MTAHDVKAARALLAKADETKPAFVATGRAALAIRGGTAFRDRKFTEDTPVPLPDAGLKAGADYGLVVTHDSLALEQITGVPAADKYLGGFHFAPGGNAAARAGGDDVPAINPWSLWDAHFRPVCRDPRGMALVETERLRFWCDIYLLGAEHLEKGTSRYGVTIADGADPPQNPDGGRFARLDYATAVAVTKHHGKGLLSLEEFFTAAYGVTEKTAVGKDPRVTKLDPARTSKFGLMQATGNVWVWGHDGDPDLPRASIFGGSWLSGDLAGSRCANVGYWPEYSIVHLGARGRCDHLQLG
jgi:hypothetical protein